MTGLDRILDKIISGAEEYAGSAVREAREKADDIISDADEKARRFKAKTEEEAEAEGQLILKRAETSSAMEKRNILLGAKRELIDDVYALAVKKLSGLDGEKYSAFLKKQLDAVLAEKPDAEYEIWSAEGGEEAVRAVIAPHANIKFSGTRKIDGGFVIGREGIEFNCTLTSAVESIRSDSEENIRKMLFAQ